MFESNLKVSLYTMLLCIVFVGQSCIKDPKSTDFQLDIPVGFPQPEFSPDNPLSNESVELGRRLFYDQALSVDSSLSCATCHKLELAMTDGLAKSLGVEGRVGTRNAPTIANVVYHPYFLREGSLPTLEQQVGVPIQEHAEFDFNMVLLAERLSGNPLYVELSESAYQQELNAFTITRSISNFERTVISGNSDYDAFEYKGISSALSSSEKHGMELFFSERLSCGECHGGFNFTQYAFKNNGLYLAYEDPGRYRFSKDSADMAKFKVPSLRNVALTAPYMHDGSIETLEEVIEHYNSGGFNHPNKDVLIQPLGLLPTEKTDLLNFLKSLSDFEFIENQALYGPM